MKRVNLVISQIVAIVLLFGCMDDSVIPTSPVDLYGSRGVFIVNEGNYMWGNASLSYYDFDTKLVTPDIFSLANGIPLGDVAYSMTIRNGRAYIVVNNSGCIYIVDSNTMLIEGQVNGLVSPRHTLFLNENTLLVSDLYARGISLVDIPTRMVTGKISTGKATLPFYQHPTENLIRINNTIFSNCWSYDNKILLIDTDQLKVIDSIEVGVQPLHMVTDGHGKIWVMNDGGYLGNPFGFEKPSLMRIDPFTLQVEVRLNFPSYTDMAGRLATNPAGDTLYFICNHLYRMPVSSNTLPTQPFIQRNGRNFRALGIDALTGNILIADAADYLSEGKVYIYRPSGLQIESFSVGIIPTAFCFN